MNLNRLPRHPLVPSLCLSAVLLGGCATKPTEPVPGPEDSASTGLLAPAEPEPEIVSHATSARDYRQDGARHLYGKNAHRIFKGKMPPLLQGVGTMVLQLDHRGNIIALNWARPPSHKGAQAEIERTVLAAAPERHAGLASGVNNAVARTAGLLAVAALPVVVGLGEAYGDPAAEIVSFHQALVVCAAMSAWIERMLL